MKTKEFAEDRIKIALKWLWDEKKLNRDSTCNSLYNINIAGFVLLRPEMELASVESENFPDILCGGSGSKAAERVEWEAQANVAGTKRGRM